MFNICISDSVFNKIKSTEEQRTTAGSSNLYKLLNQQHVQLLTESDTARFKEHPESVLDNPSSLYILNITPSEALAIQRQYGVICLSGEHPDISPLIDVNDIHTPNEGVKLARGWDSVLDSVEKLPSNALLLTDRYLFASRNKDIGDGLANVQSILTELLPLEFAGAEYHVTVVFCKDKKHNSYKFSEIVTKLNNIAQQMDRHYSIMMEVFGISEGSDIYNNLHNRRIISNYYLVEATHKLAAFNRNLGTTQQILLPLALFTESSINGKSTSPLDSINQTIEYLHDFYEDILHRKDEDIDYLYAFNGKVREKCLGIRNRLLK
jgi:hypothetical protein